MLNDWLPLLRYLAALPPEQERVDFSVDDLVALVGGLRARARRPRFWSHSATAHCTWQFIGFSAHLQAPHGSVVFTRRQRWPGR